MGAKETIAQVGLGLLGGYVGTKVMEPVSMKLYEWESAEDRRREDAVRPGAPFQIAARKTTQLLGLRLSDQQLETLGTVGFHYGLGMGCVRTGRAHRHDGVGAAPPPALDLLLRGQDLAEQRLPALLELLALVRK